MESKIVLFLLDVSAQKLDSTFLTSEKTLLLAYLRLELIFVVYPTRSKPFLNDFSKTKIDSETEFIKKILCDDGFSFGIGAILDSC